MDPHRDQTPPASLAGDSESTQITALRAQVARLEAQIVARDNLLAVAAHELRNPMHTILLLVRATLMIAQREQVTSLTPKLERIRHVVDTYMKRATLLLDSVRLEAKGWVGDKTEFDLSDLVREICASYEPEAQFAGSAVVVDAPDSMRGCWDRLAMEQIVSNLVSNAIKYGEAKPVEISLTAVEGMAQLVVRDQGAGIAESDQRLIFERFQQAIGSGRRRGGFGIGLWLVRSLVEALGGSIALQSSLQQGSTFTIVLPGLLTGAEAGQSPCDSDTGAAA